MNQQQYKAYEREFDRKVPIRKFKRKGQKGLGCLGAVIWEVTIKIPFNKLGTIMDVELAVMKEECP